MKLFDFGRANHLYLAIVVSNDDHRQQISRWLSGRIFGLYISIMIPWRKRLS
jgi:hypothetical protein